MAADVQLALDVRKFHMNPQLQGEVELGVKLLDPKGRIVTARVIRAGEPAQAHTGPASAVALNRAFAEVTNGLVIWTARSLIEINQPKPTTPKKAVGG
jgi:ABC-type uncharacterized transport system auxiliary subunit